MLAWHLTTVLLCAAHFLFIFKFFKKKRRLTNSDLTTFLFGIKLIYYCFYKGNYKLTSEETSGCLLEDAVWIWSHIIFRFFVNTCMHCIESRMCGYSTRVLVYTCRNEKYRCARTCICTLCPCMWNNVWLKEILLSFIKKMWLKAWGQREESEFCKLSFFIESWKFRVERDRDI